MLASSSRLVNLGVGAIMVLGGISQFFPIGLYGPIFSTVPLPGFHPNKLTLFTSQSVVVGCYVIIFGLGVSGL